MMMSIHLTQGVRTLGRYLLGGGGKGLALGLQQARCFGQSKAVVLAFSYQQIINDLNTFLRSHLGFFVLFCFVFVVIG